MFFILTTFFSDVICLWLISYCKRICKNFMLAPIYVNYPDKTFESFGFKSDKDHFFSFPKRKPLTNMEKLSIGIGTLAGTAIPMMQFCKKQKVPIWKLKYSEKEMILLSTGSISGGVAGGLLSDRKVEAKYKIHEGVFQFFNAIIPTLLIKPILKICENIKALNNMKAKAAALLCGIFGGMFAGAKISNKINGTTSPNNRRKVKFIDTIANIDVISGALIMAKFPFVGKLGVEKFLPLFYMWTGYESGKMR